MTENRTILSHRTAPTSPLDRYRGIMEQNPIKDHFTDKRLRKHMRHVGLMTKPSNNKDRAPTPLARVEYQIQNSGQERYKRFRQKFIATMIDTIEEVDRARQAEFRDQLELWNKMYLNRIQRIKTRDGRLERKYGLFVDREMKKELIRENLSKIPQIRSVSMPHIMPVFAPKRSMNRAKFKNTKSVPSASPPREHVNDVQLRLDQLIELLTKLENEEFQTDLNKIVKDHNMLKIIQSEHEQKIDQLTTLVTTLERTTKAFKNLSEESTNIRQEQKNAKKDLEIEDQQQKAQIKQISHHSQQFDYTNTINDINSKLQTSSGNDEQFIRMHQQIPAESNVEKGNENIFEINKIEDYLINIYTRIETLERQHSELTEKPSNVIDNSNQIKALQSELKNVHQFYSNKTEMLEKEMSMFRDHIHKLQTLSQPMQTSSQSSNKNKKTYDEDLKFIQNKQQQFDHSLRAFIGDMNILREAVSANDKQIHQFNNTITIQQQQLQKIFSDQLEGLNQKISTSRDELSNIIHEQINKVKENAMKLGKKIVLLEQTINNGMKKSHTEKQDSSPYVEKLAPLDLFEIDWIQYKQENQRNTTN